jgi:prepilin-type N-terminal cleavage/methylation domain-containing protein
MRTSKPPAAGYTLLELVVVLAIMSMMMLITAPKFLPRLFETRLETSARRFAAMTKYLHAHTALAGGEATLHIDVAAGEYWVTTPPLEEDELEEDEQDGATPKFGLTTEEDIDFEIDLGGPVARGDDTVLGLEFDLDKLIDGNDEDEEVEMTTSFIARTKLIDGVAFAGLLMPGAEADRNETEFEIEYGPFGLKVAAYIVLEDKAGKKLGIRLDPVLGQSSVEVPDGALMSALGLGGSAGGAGL